jgi:ABC-type antimicrobial peptide transport system permease subunit
LVTLQFALSVIVLIGGVIFVQNAKFQEALKFGYDKEMVITVNIQSEKEFEVMENVISSNSKIVGVSVSEHNIGQSSDQSTVQVGVSEYPAQLIGIGKNYFETMGLKLHEGRLLNVANASDQKEAVIVNRAFVDKVGMKDPLNKVVTVKRTKRHIVGVIENHVEDIFITKAPEPFVFYAAESSDYKMMQVKAEAKDLADTRKYLEDKWRKMFPNKAFDSQYQEEIVLGDARMLNGSFKSIFLFLTVLGGLLSVSGIFSLASLNIARRTKEIGIRKALGATATNVIALLNKEFVVILTLAAIVGSVGGFYLVQTLLSMFNMQHVSVGIFPVVLCGLLIFTVGIFTTSVTILKAASTNPVDTLRSE